MDVKLLCRNRSRPLMVMAATVIVIASLGFAAPASAAASDGHYCGWISPDSPPGKTENPKIINFTASVQCDGPVRRVDLTVELLYHGLVPGPGQTVNGRTEVWQNTNGTLFGLGVNSPGTLCESGYYSGRATATVQFLSGTPEFITRTAESQPVSLTCPPPDIPIPPPSGAVTVTNPGTQSSLKPDTVSLQMQATGGSGSYTWSATGLPPGLAINPSTGRISGTLSTIGSYTVTVTADGGGQGSTTFSWSVRKDSPCTRC
ncbi:Ig domain-containing protein [Micromonospora ureilytica]|uniref:Ig domain-containing protein n=1 Tax=Micromonospora ureilytica TaxID=709868 RepID=UPI002E0D18FA|nr:Ig domain-containing protein [Micromonospora ureilytica]